MVKSTNKKFRNIALIVISAILIAIFNLYPHCYNDKILVNNVLDLAHRGYAGVNKGGTIEAFKFAINNGADGLELDIRQTKDGVIVVSHDHHLGGFLTKKVEELTYSEIIKQKMLLKFDEIIKLTKIYNIKIWVEIKDSELYPEIVNNLVEMIKKNKIEKNIIIQSFKMEDLIEVNTAVPKVQLLKLYLFKNNFKNYPKFIDYVGLPLATGMIDCSVIKKIHQGGIKIIFWRESSMFENSYVIKNLIKKGADGFMLDMPLINYTTSE